jgi:hypothetical protein
VQTGRHLKGETNKGVQVGNGRCEEEEEQGGGEHQLEGAAGASDDETGGV